MSGLQILFDLIDDCKDGSNETELKNQTDLNHLVNALKEKTVFQICFLVDVTRSAKRYKYLSNEFVTLFTQATLNVRLPKAHFSYAYVGYRERDEKFAFEQMTNDSERVIKAIRETKRTGGDDDAEDVEFGLKMVYEDIKWEHGGTRILIHIADAPCHGKRYHDDSVSDFHPDWSNKIPDYLTKVVNNLSVFYWFVELTNETKIMQEEFNNILCKFQKNSNVDYYFNVIDMKNSREEMKNAVLNCLEISWFKTNNSK